VIGDLRGCFCLRLRPVPKRQRRQASVPTSVPGGQIVVHDTIFHDIIARDSSFRGYVAAYQAIGAPRQTCRRKEPPVFPPEKRDYQSAAAGDRLPRRCRSPSIRRGSGSRSPGATRRRPNLRLRLFQLPLTMDSTSILRASIRIFSGSGRGQRQRVDLLARPAIGDSVTVRIWGDSIRTDSAGHVLKISPGRLDAAPVLHARYVQRRSACPIPGARLWRVGRRRFIGEHHHRNE